MSEREIYYEGNDKMNYLTLYDFLRQYNFRHYDSEAPTEELKCNTSVVRIHCGHCDGDWFEFGTYNYGSGVSLEDIVKTAINPQLLSRRVVEFFVDEYLNILRIILEEDE